MPLTNMPYGIAEQAVLSFLGIIKKYLPKEQWQTRISIYGGEPLLNRPVLYRILEKFGRTYEGVGLNWIVNTNGSLLNKEDLEYFLPNKVDIHLSVDGKENKHNLARRDKRNGETFRRVMKAIELIEKNGYPYLQFDSVLNPLKTDSAIEILDLAKEKKVSRIHLDLFYSSKYPKDFSAEEYGRSYAQAYLEGRRRKISIYASNFSNLVYYNFWNDAPCRPPYQWFPSLEVFNEGNFIFSELPLIKPFDSLENLSKDEIWSRRINLLLELEKETKAKCKNCYLVNHCHGDMRRVFRYHTSTVDNEDNICKTARVAAAELLKNNFIP